MQEMLFGSLEVLVAVTCFGSVFVPIKKLDGGDGLFVQWIIGAGVFVVGCVVHALVGFTTFYPLACVGGFCWAMGNVVCVPTMRRLGMAVSMLVWNAVNCVMGWAAGSWGLFGLEAKPASIQWLNIVGVVFILAGAVLFALVRRTEQEDASSAHALPSVPSKSSAASTASFGLAKVSASSLESELELELEAGLTMSAPALPEAKSESSFGCTFDIDRLTGLGMALMAGVFFGGNVIPVMYIQDHPQRFGNAPANGLAYIFSHFCGVFLTTTILFAVYSVMKRNRPVINAEICLPAMASGILWGTAQSVFFAAQQHLSSSVTYPIVSMVPGCVAALWSVFYFREIRGRRDLTLLCAALTVTLTGTVLVAISK